MGHLTTLDLWKGPFGNEYHQRNRFTVEQVKPVFDRILDGIQVDSVLEVGCGLGHNLMAIDAETRVGIDVNEAAIMEARQTHPEAHFISGDALGMLYLMESDSVDLIVTCGLLIHVPPDLVKAYVEEIARVSSRYVLCIEYAAAEEEMVEYRGEKDALWRRPFGKLFQAWAGMTLVAHDDADSNLYPGSEWWLLEK